MKSINGVTNRKTQITRVIVTVLTFCFALICVFPFIWMISTSFKFEIDVMEFPIRIIPKRVNLQNYVRVFTKSNFPLYYLNTIKVTLVTVLGELVITTFAGYSFARLRYRGKKLIYAIYLATMMVPSQVMLLPKYIYFSKLHLTNTHWALILPGFFSVFGVLLMRQGFSQVPFELTEAAYVDGANHFTIFSRLILPLVKPSLMTALLLSFTWCWNDYMNPLIFISKESLLTLTVGLQRFQEDASTNYALIMAGATVSLIPILVLFGICQKSFIESFASAGIKG